MSLLLRPEFAPEQASMLTIVAGLSVAQSIREETGLKAQIKWPNDIVINGKKLVGILTEMSTEIDYINHVVIGVGINVNIREFPKDICETATSLYIEEGRTVKRAPLIAEVMRRFEEYYGKFEKAGNLSLLKEEYNGLLINRDREVRILGSRETYTARALGINETGELLVIREDGTQEEVYAGEVSVRGVYGYV